MSILQAALESRIDEVQSEKDEKLIVMRGPLSEIIHRALNIVYNKDSEEAQLKDFALESIAQDIVIAQNIIESVTNDETNKDADYVIYGVSKNEVEPETLVEVKSILEDRTNNSEFIMMISDNQDTTDLTDNPIQSNVDGKVSAMSTALESLIEGYPNTKIIKGSSVGQVINLLLSDTFGV